VVVEEHEGKSTPRREARHAPVEHAKRPVISRYPATAMRLLMHWCRDVNRRHNVVARHLRRRWARQRCMQVPPFGPAAHESIVDYRDYHRYATIALALSRIEAAGIPGALAEAGVYQGYASRFIHRLAPHRRYYLFDTFAGFHADDLDAGAKADLRFRDTSLETVLRTIGDTANIEPRPGRVPETFAGLQGERFAFVLLDMDLHRPTLHALEFFYPRLSAGAYLMVHDYHNPESNWGCKRAVDEFMADKPEGVIELADMWGSVIVRRARAAPGGAGA
jgi:O-methyltransferase